MGKDKEGKFHPKKGKPSGDGTRKGIPDVQPARTIKGVPGDDLKVLDPNHQLKPPKE